MQHDDWIRIGRYFAGECSPEERAAVEAWIAEAPERTQLIERLQAAWNEGADSTEPFDQAIAWDAILRRRAARSSEIPTVGTRKKEVFRPQVDRHRERSLTRWLAIAATLIVMIGGAAVWKLSSGKKTIARAPDRQYTTERGQRANVRLADGTKIVLAPESRLVVPPDFDSVSRAVTLEGEAYFDVAHDAAKPFVVRAGTALVRDVGTRFDVRAYLADSSTRVLVTNGKAEVRHASATSQPRLLGEHDVGRIAWSGRISVETGVDTTRYVAWTTGALIFARTPVPQAIIDIARWYDVELKADPTFAHRTLTTVLHDQPLDEVLDLVALAINARITRSGHTITLMPKGGTSR